LRERCAKAWMRSSLTLRVTILGELLDPRDANLHQREFSGDEEAIQDNQANGKPEKDQRHSGCPEKFGREKNAGKMSGSECRPFDGVILAVLNVVVLAKYALVAFWR
jgi:hypothetical protein